MAGLAVTDGMAHLVYDTRVILAVLPRMVGQLVPGERWLRLGLTVGEGLLGGWLRLGLGHWLGHGEISPGSIRAAAATD